MLETISVMLSLCCCMSTTVQNPFFLTGNLMLLIWRLKMTKSVALSLRFGKNELHYWCSVCKFLKQLSANNEQPVVEWKGCAFCWKDWHTLADTLIWYLDLEWTQLNWTYLQYWITIMRFRDPLKMQVYKKAMTEVRVSVEWMFGNITKYFSFVDFKRQMKVNLSAVGKMYFVSTLLENAHTCLYGNIVSKAFQLLN